MRIAICNTLYPPIGIGGAERSVKFLAEALQRLGHTVAVFSQGVTWKREEERINGVMLVRTSSPPGFRPNIYAHKPLLHKVQSRLFSAFRPDRTQLYIEEIKRFKPDVVHTNSAGALDKLWDDVTALNIPVVHTLRNHASLCSKRMFVENRACIGQCEPCIKSSLPRRIAAERLSAVVGISSYILQEHLAAGYFRTVTRRRVIPNSYELEGPLRRRGPVSGPVQFGYLGRLHETKGVRELILSMNKLIGEAELVIAGTGNPEFVAELRELAGENVRFLGFVEAAEAFAQMDALVVPSLWNEPFGRIYAESLVHGVPVLGSIYGAGTELVEDGVTGWLCNPADPKDLLKSLRRASRALSSGRDFSDACLLAGKRFATMTVADAYVEVYQLAIDAGVPAQHQNFAQLKSDERDALLTKLGRIYL